MYSDPLARAMLAKGLDQAHLTLDDELEVLVFGKLFRKIDHQAEPRADMDRVLQIER